MPKSIQIAKPDKSRSCVWCRHCKMRNGKLTLIIKCNYYGMDFMNPDEAQSCAQFKDSRLTYQVISASGKVGMP